MNMNQMHSQLEYQTGLLNQSPQQSQMLPDHNSVYGYQTHTQPSQSNFLYNLNFNHHMDQLQPYDTSGSAINANAIYHHHHHHNSELNPNQHETIETPSSGSDKNHRATANNNNNNKSSSGMGPKRQKKMKLNNDLENQSDLLEQSNSNYLYQNNYYHKQSLIGSSSITSSNSSSTSSSPLSSTSPSHHQAHHHQLTQMGLSTGMNYHAGGKKSMLSQSHFSATGVVYPSNQLFGCMEDTDTLKQQQQQESNVNNGTGYDIMMDTNNSMEEFSQRVKLKKSKKDPISEYDSELAESIEFELGLKKQNGPRKNSWGNLSYAELITRAIESSSDQRLTLSQIYDWIVKYVPYFKEKFDRTSSAGWKNSIRHNLSLHNRFIRVQNESSGKSSWWMINPDMSKYSLNTPMCSNNMIVPNSGISGNPYSFGPTQAGHMMPTSSEDNNNNFIEQPLNEPTLVESSENNNDVYNLNQLTVVKEENKDGSSCPIKLEQTEQSSEAQSHLSPEYQAASDKQKGTTNTKLGSTKANKSGARSQTKSLASKSKSKLPKSETSSKSDKKDPSASYSPPSPGSTSSLKENDSMKNGIANNNTNPVLSNATISALDNNNKLSQSHIYYPTQGNNNTNNSSTNGIQQSLLMDSPSSIASSSSSSNIPYATTANADSGSNSILRAALQKSTNNNITGSPSSSNNSNPPTPTTISQTSGMSFSNLNSHVYNSSRQHFYANPNNSGASYQNNMPFGSYNSNSYQYQGSFNPDVNKQQMLNQTFFQPTNMQTGPYNSTGDSPAYYASNLALASTTVGSSLLTPTSVPIPDSSSPGSTSTSSSASSNYSNSRNNCSSHIYSSYYNNNQQAVPQQNSMVPSIAAQESMTVQPIYQNGLYKGSQSQYSTSNLYDQTLMNSSSSYYDLNMQTMQSAKAATETSVIEQMTSNNIAAESANGKSSSNNSLLNDEVTQFQELLKPQVVAGYYN